MRGISRRQFVAGLGATAALGHSVYAAQDRRTRLILLGTGGGHVLERRTRRPHKSL